MSRFPRESQNSDPNWEGGKVEVAIVAADVMQLQEKHCPRCSHKVAGFLELCLLRFREQQCVK